MDSTGNMKFTPAIESSEIKVTGGRAEEGGVRIEMYLMRSTFKTFSTIACHEQS